MNRPQYEALFNAYARFREAHLIAGLKPPSEIVLTKSDRKSMIYAGMFFLGAPYRCPETSLTSLYGMRLVSSAPHAAPHAT